MSDSGSRSSGPSLTGEERNWLHKASPYVSKAVETLVGLLDTGDGRLKRLAAKDILNQYANFKELDELTRRIERIEEQLETRQDERTLEAVVDRLRHGTGS